MSEPWALTRDERFDRVNVLIGRSGLVASDMDELRGHVGALCRTLAQQAQELERVNERAEAAESWVGYTRKERDDLKQQLAASQARCRDMEREIETLTTCGCEGCDDNLEESAFCFPCMNKVQQQVTQLQATLAAREATILQQAKQADSNYEVYEMAKHQRDAAVQEAGRLRERVKELVGRP